MDADCDSSGLMLDVLLPITAQLKSCQDAKPVLKRAPEKNLKI
jgi:hypothetical protein